MKPGVSALRNPRLFSYAIKDGIPYHGIGSSVRRTLNLYADVSFENDEGGLFLKTIVLYTEHESDNRENNREGNRENNREGNREDNREDNREGNREDNSIQKLPDKQQEICSIVAENPSISMQMLANRLSVRLSTIEKQMKALKSKGILVREGGTRGYWRVIQRKTDFFLPSPTPHLYNTYHMAPFFLYSGAPYVRECLDSVLASAYTDWEAICVKP